MGTGESKSLCPGSPHDPDCVYLDLSGAVNPIAYKEVGIISVLLLFSRD